MQYREACLVADVLPARNPCMQVVMIGRATDMMRDLGVPIPAWTIPAASWLVVTHHEGEQGCSVIGRADRDAHLTAALRDAGHYCPRNRDGRLIRRFKRGTLYTWVCPEHTASKANDE